VAGSRGSIVFQFDAAHDGGTIDDQYFVRVGDGRLLPFVLKAGEDGGYVGPDLPVRGDDDLCPAHDLGDLEVDGAGEVRLGEVNFRAAHDGGDIAAFEILRQYFLMDAAEDGGGFYIVLGGVAFAGGGEGLLALVTPLTAVAPVPLVTPVHFFLVPIVAPLLAPLGAAAVGAEDDEQPEEDEEAGPHEPVDMGVGVVVLHQEEAADGHKDQPAAAAEIVAQAYKEPDGDQQDMPVEEYLQSYADIAILQECSDGFEGIKAIQQHRPDLIFLDVQMPKINGFEMLELVEDPPAVIFTTAFDEYAIKAFESHAIDYLLKPFNKERFDKAVRKWLDTRATRGSDQLTHGPGATAHGPAGAPPAADTEGLLETAAQSPTQQHRIVVKTGGKIKIIPLEDIHFLEAADDYVKIHTHNGAFLKNRTMGYFEKTLDGTQFVRTHRSYILNVQQVTRIDPYEKDSHLCILQSGAQVPVSKAGYVKLKAVLGL